LVDVPRAGAVARLASPTPARRSLRESCALAPKLKGIGEDWWKIGGKRKCVNQINLESSLHTGEVVGSIPTAPTISQALLGSVRQYRAERYVHAHAQTGSNPGDLFTVCIWPQTPGSNHEIERPPISWERECSSMTSSHKPPVYRFDIDHGTSDAPRPPRTRSNPQELAPGYLWNGTTQELIPILPEDHPDYRDNVETIGAAFRRWERGTSK
jgi:hypothetical protein